MRPLWELLSDLKRLGVRLSLNQQTGRLQYQGTLDPDRLDEALKHAEKAEKIAPNNPYVLDAAGWVYVQRGDVPRALPRLTEAAQRLPGNPVVQYHLGMAYYKNKNLRQAKEALQNALRISKDFEGADEAIRILEKIK